MKLQQLLSYTRRAVDDYHMIEEGDKIAVGISGGKDSLALLYALSGLRRFYPKHFDLEAITVDLGYDNFDLTDIKKLCDELNVNYTIVKTDIGHIIFEDRKEKNPCSLCSKMRKGAFNQKAKELGCNKLAYGHHRDDLVETMLLSLIFEGHFYSFSPMTYLDRMDITLIRPLLYVEEADIIGFQHKYNLPVSKNPCPADGVTKREYAKNLAKQLNRDHPGAIDRMFSAIINGNLPNWPKKH
ncbi:MAG: tRNA 2-thiocytidine(32) synthetase TtcA [Clostridiales bacterium]|nr:tRNA 2-thiocytidine(32) synthetase TtcA [Clostridiales bacterium]MDY3746698.1 ATP-binding protein [Lachnospiraceae bacterium]